MIRVTWWDSFSEKEIDAIVSNEDGAFSLCNALDSDKSVTQWKTDQPLEGFPWYKESMWFKMKHYYKDWEYN